MKLKDVLVEKYDKKHKCLTPGAIYSTEIHDKLIEITIKLPKKLDMLEDESLDLESDLHYAVEKVLAKFFK